jgi:hypothetical protein
MPTGVVHCRLRMCSMAGSVRQRVRACFIRLDCNQNGQVVIFERNQKESLQLPRRESAPSRKWTLVESGFTERAAKGFRRRIGMRVVLAPEQP